MTILVLIRHGRSVANAQGLLAGRRAGVGLDETGREQARQLAERLSSVPFAAVYRSPILRCAQTAELAGWPDAVVDDRLTECDYGTWTNRALADLAREPLWGRIMAEPSAVAFPGGESMAAMRGRVVDAAADICARHLDEDVVGLISHADPIKAIVSHFLAQGFDDFQRIVVAPASISVVEVPRDGRPVVRCINAGWDPTAMLARPATPAVGGGDIVAPPQ